MSRLQSFAVGLIVSGTGYAYLSHRLVSSRNRMMVDHFACTNGVETYVPPRKIPAGMLPSWLQGEGADQEPAPPKEVTSPHEMHPLVLDARKQWNAAVMRASDAVVKALYGDRGRKSRGEGDNDASRGEASP